MALRPSHAASHHLLKKGAPECDTVRSSREHGTLATAVQATAADALTTVFPLAETPQEGSVVVQVQEPGAMPAPWTLGFQVFTDPPRVVLADAPPKGSVIEIGYELDVGD